MNMGVVIKLNLALAGAGIQVGDTVTNSTIFDDFVVFPDVDDKNARGRQE